MPATVRIVADLLPEPDSEQIGGLVGSAAQRLIYGLLYRRRDSPPTMAELRFLVANALGEEQSQADRCVRELGGTSRSRRCRPTARADMSCDAGRRHRPPARAAPSAPRPPPKCRRPPRARRAAG